MVATDGIFGSMIPQFPTLTYPNHFSLVTGVYPEIHGIVSNRFFDPSYNDTFSYKDASQMNPKWWNFDPVRLSPCSYYVLHFLFSFGTQSKEKEMKRKAQYPPGLVQKL